MCIVIDINTLAMVFNVSSARHGDFADVKKYVESRAGYVVFGGTKCKEELALTGRYLRLLRQLRDAGKAVSILDSAVDEIEASVLVLTANTDCDDQHVIALLAASRCTLLCSVDNRSFPFVKDRSLYPNGCPAVKIYTSPRNKKLLKRSTPSCLRNVEAGLG
jgi:hypothetical protein